MLGVLLLLAFVGLVVRWARSRSTLRATAIDANRMQRGPQAEFHGRYAPRRGRRRKGYRW